jgi:hypothetical protein
MSELCKVKRCGGGKRMTMKSSAIVVGAGGATSRL